MTLKDWTSSSIALIALCITVFVTYFKIFRQRDDLRVALSGGPLWRSEINKAEEIGKVVKDTIVLTFINSGNRPAAIIEARIS